MANPGFPYPGHHIAVREGNCNLEYLTVYLHRRYRQFIAGVGLVACDLLAMGIDALDEVALLVQQANRDKRQGEVTGGLAVIPGQDAQAARRIGKLSWKPNSAQK